MNYKPDNEGKYMALYAIGDLHLSFQSDKNMDHFGKVWRIYEIHHVPSLSSNIDVGEDQPFHIHGRSLLITHHACKKIVVYGHIMCVTFFADGWKLLRIHGHAVVVNFVTRHEGAGEW